MVLAQLAVLFFSGKKEAKRLQNSLTKEGQRGVWEKEEGSLDGGGLASTVLQSPVLGKKAKEGGEGPMVVGSKDGRDFKVIGLEGLTRYNDR